MEVDFLGRAAVCSFIAQTGLTQFIIQKIGAAKNSAPIFSFVDNKTNGRAVEEFSRFANSINSSQPYEMVLFNNIDELDQDESTQYERKKKSKMIRFTFQLKEDKSVGSISDPKELFAGMLNEMKREQENNALLAEIRELKAKIDKIETEEEEEEEEAEQVGNLNIMGGLTLNHVDGILARLAAYGIIKAPQGQPTPTNAQFAGDQTTAQEIDVKKTNIEKAVNILYKYDKDLDTDLLKLASVAENNNALFNVILQQLRSM